MSKRYTPLGGAKPVPVRSVNHAAGAKYTKPRVKPAQRNGNVTTMAVTFNEDGTIADRTVVKVTKVQQHEARVIKPKQVKPTNWIKQVEDPAERDRLERMHARQLRIKKMMDDARQHDLSTGAVK